METNMVRLDVELTKAQAREFAQFLKRVTFQHYAECSTSKEEAYLMVDAGEAIRKALAEAGYSPR